MTVETNPPAPATQPSVPAAVSAKPKSPKWETDTRERLRFGVKKFAKPLADFIARDVNEADTRFLVTDFLCEALGYDKFSDLTAEFAIKGEFADYGLRVDKQLVALIEVKRVTTKLSPKHLRQVEDYGVREGVEWLILTNAAQWRGLPPRLPSSPSAPSWYSRPTSPAPSNSRRRPTASSQSPATA